jgi:hypothetical protein
MNVQLNPKQSDTKAGAFSLAATADLTGLENFLVKVSNSSGTAKFALPGAVTDLALFVLDSGDVAANDNWAEQPAMGASFRVRLNGTCVPGDILVLCDPTASAGVNAGKVEAVAAQTAGRYFSPGIALETGADEQDVLACYLPRTHVITTSITDSTTGSAAATTFAAGVGVSQFGFQVDLNDIAGSNQVLTTFTPGYKFKILASAFAVDKAVTTGSKLATVTPQISGVSTTGGAIALTSALATPAGAVIAGSAITALNTGAANATIGLVASAVTQFTEGTGTFYLTIQNMDTADAIASLLKLLTGV